MEGCKSIVGNGDNELGLGGGVEGAAAGRELEEFGELGW